MGGNNSSTVQRFPFSTPFATATNVGDLAQTTNFGTGISSSDDGYIVGGVFPSGQLHWTYSDFHLLPHHSAWLHW